MKRPCPSNTVLFPGNLSFFLEFKKHKTTISFPHGNWTIFMCFEHTFLASDFVSFETKSSKLAFVCIGSTSTHAMFVEILYAKINKLYCSPWENIHTAQHRAHTERRCMARDFNAPLLIFFFCVFHSLVLFFALSILTCHFTTYSTYFLEFK